MKHLCNLEILIPFHIPTEIKVTNKYIKEKNEEIDSKLKEKKKPRGRPKYVTKKNIIVKQRIRVRWIRNVIEMMSYIRL